MKIAIVGVGGIGSTFALQLVRAGHDVTVVARNRRLEQLRRDGGIKTSKGVVATRIAGELPIDVAFDLVLVTVLAHQLEPLLKRLGKSAARTIMFMFNTFAPLATLRDVVGDRFAFGFPAILAQVNSDGVLISSIPGTGLLTTVNDAKWAKVFTEAGIPTVTTPDMESWLRSHAAAVVPVMLAAAEAHRTRRGISWSRARELAAAMDDAFKLVRELGHDIIPTAHAVVGKMPAIVMASFLWTASRSAVIQASGVAGDAEPRALIDAMLGIAKHDRPALSSVRPRESAA